MTIRFFCTTPADRRENGQMQFYSFVLFQMDEARRLITDGRPEHIRLALLLLDNCAEMQMAEYIRGALASERTQEKLQRSYRDVFSPDDTSEYVKEIFAFQPLSLGDKRGIERNFEEKVRYMVVRAKTLDASLAAPLLHIHRYRNEAYHRNAIRPETVRTACLVLLEVNCEMVLTVPRHHMSRRSSVDYSWLRERFGVDDFLSKEQLAAVVTAFRSGLIPEVHDVTALLTEYMRDRFAAFYHQLSYIVGNLPSMKLADEEAALAEAYSYWNDRVKFPDGELPRKHLEPHPLTWIKERERLIDGIEAAGSRLEAFERFAAIEHDFEPIETAVDEVVGEIDSYIDMQIDIMRGK